MKEINKMRLGVLKELKKIIRFFEEMEKGVKSRDPSKIYPAYIFIRAFAYQMNKGELSPLSIELHQELLHQEYLLQDEQLQ
jgi:hypothetical protein